MSGTFTQGRAEGQLPSSKGTLLTAGGLGVLVKTVILVNTSADAVTVNLYFTRITSRRVIPKNYSLAPGAQFEMDFNSILLAGDLVEGDASVATTVDYCLSYVTET